MGAGRTASARDLLRRSRVKVCIPTPLRSYTNAQKWVDADGATVAELLDDLDRQFPGIRFRVVDERAESSADDVVRDGLGRVKRAGRFAGSRSCAQFHACAASRRAGISPP